MLSQDAKMSADNLKVKEVMNAVNSYLDTVTERREYLSFLFHLHMAVMLQYEYAKTSGEYDIIEVLEDPEQLSEKLKLAYEIFFDPHEIGVGLDKDWSLGKASGEAIRDICLKSLSNSSLSSESYDLFLLTSLKRHLADLFEEELRKVY